MPKENYQLPIPAGSSDLYVRKDDVFKTISHGNGTKTWRRVYNLALEIVVHDYIACTSMGPAINYLELRSYVRTRAIVYPDALRSIGLNLTYRKQQAMEVPYREPTQAEYEILLVGIKQLEDKIDGEARDMEAESGEPCAEGERLSVPRRRSRSLQDLQRTS